MCKFLFKFIINHIYLNWHTLATLFMFLLDLYYIINSTYTIYHTHEFYGIGVNAKGHYGSIAPRYRRRKNTQRG